MFEQKRPAEDDDGGRNDNGDGNERGCMISSHRVEMMRPVMTFKKDIEVGSRGKKTRRVELPLRHVRTVGWPEALLFVTYAYDWCLIGCGLHEYVAGPQPERCGAAILSLVTKNWGVVRRKQNTTQHRG